MGEMSRMEKEDNTKSVREKKKYRSTKNGATTDRERIENRMNEREKKRKKKKTRCDTIKLKKDKMN